MCLKNIGPQMANSKEDFKKISQDDLKKIAEGRIGVWEGGKLKIREASYAQRKMAQSHLQSRDTDEPVKITTKERAHNVVISQKEITINGIREALGIKKGTPQDNTLRGRLSEMASAGIITRIKRGLYRIEKEA